MERKCPKCSGEMEAGFILDKGRKILLSPEWIAGPPEVGWWGMVKTKDRNKFSMETWRCKSCGYLDFYALRPSRT